jgi:hypothetical protein
MTTPHLVTVLAIGPDPTSTQPTSRHRWATSTVGLKWGREPVPGIAHPVAVPGPAAPLNSIRARRDWNRESGYLLIYGTNPAHQPSRCSTCA